MGKLSLRLIALGLLILALGAMRYMDFMDFIAKRNLSDPLAMLFSGICLISVGKFGSSNKK